MAGEVAASVEGSPGEVFDVAGEVAAAVEGSPGEVSALAGEVFAVAGGLAAAGAWTAAVGVAVPGEVAVVAGDFAAVAEGFAGFAEAETESLGGDAAVVGRLAAVAAVAGRDGDAGVGLCPSKRMPTLSYV